MQNMKHNAPSATDAGPVRASWPALTALRVLALWALPAALAFGQTPDEDAIKAVIKAETEAAFKRDATAWQATWLHEAKASRTLLGVGGDNAPAVGWDKLSAAMFQEIKEHPTPMPVEFTSDQYLISTDGRLAWVEYDQALTAPGVFPTFHSREQRALRKENGEWKIFSQVTTNKDLFDTGPAAVDLALNTAGDKLLAANKPQEAAEVFKVNAALNPRSWYAHDRLGAAYAKARLPALAIKSYEKSVLLNPANASGKLALTQLKHR